MHYFSNLFWYRTLHVLDRSAVHHQQYTQQWVLVIQVMLTDCLCGQDGTAFFYYKNISLCTVL